jgi:arginine/lysine/ornithine decarboxylase
MNLWFSEYHAPDVRHSMRVTRHLYSSKSDYQQIDIFDTPEFGKVLALDGNVMLTERDEFIYDEMINGDSIFDFDPTKLSVHTRDIGLAGIEVYDILRDEYDIQIEFGDIGNILAYLSIGDRMQELERLVSALAEIRRRYKKDPAGLLSQEYIDPEVVCSPQEAFYSQKKSIPINESSGFVCSEFVMCYPPGIPILAPGERITKDIIDYIQYAKAKGCSMTGSEDPDINNINVLV